MKVPCVTRTALIWIIPGVLALLLAYGGCSSEQLDNANTSGVLSVLDTSTANGLIASGTAPTATGQVAWTTAATPTTVQLAGSSSTGDPLQFAIVSFPHQGTLSAIRQLGDITAEVTYTPTAGFAGKDEFSYDAYDGTLSSNPAPVVVGVCPQLSFSLDVYDGGTPLTVNGVASILDSAELRDGQLCWKWGDGTEDCGAVSTYKQKSHTFTKPGVYTVVLTIALAGIPGDSPCITGQSAQAVVTVTGSTNSLPTDLEVVPADGLASSGGPGGPFSPASMVYTLRNASDGPIDWTAANTTGWLSLSSTGGKLAAGASITLTASVNAEANDLVPGSYNDAITITNTKNANSNTTRGVSLTVLAPGALAVTPEGDRSSAGYVGGPFDPDSHTYTLTNTGGAPLNWTASNTRTWASLSRTGGTLAPRASTTLTVSINSAAGELSAGTYDDTVTITNTTNGDGNTARRLTLSATVFPWALAVTPGTALVSAGVAGGPFSPSSQQYTLSNTSGASIDWTASATRPWISLSRSSGTLAPGGSTTVVVSINTQANSLAAGSYSDTVSFANATNGSGNTTRGVSLTVTAPGALSVTPGGPLNSAGLVGGPFNPNSLTYTLTNTGGVPINWTASKTQSWVTISSTGGTLTAGGSTTFSVAINSGANSLAAGSYSDTITITNATNGGGNTTRGVSLTVTAPGALSVTPSIALSSAGMVGGPFSPSSQAYTLTNTGGLSISWTASKTRNWVTLSSASGTLAAGGTTTLTVSINSGANSLAAGNYSDTVTITNTTNGSGNTTRGVSLAVTAPGTLSVTPGSALTSAGLVGGPFSPSLQAYTLTNTGGVSVNWTASKTQSWVTLSSAGGALAPGGTATLTVSINSGANSLAAGSYADTVTITNTTNGAGNTTRGVSLTVTAPGALSVTPAGALTSAGVVGGPFSPSSQAYTLTNTGGASINWTASKTQSWVTLSSASGVLAAGGTATLTVSINSGANSLAAGSYGDTVTITNSTNGSGSTTRSVSLTVSPTSSCKTSTASWQNTAFSSQSGVFTAQFDVTPSSASMDGVTALSAAACTGYADCAVLIRFNTGGTIDIRNGGSYGADTTVAYAGGSTYHFRVVANVTAHTYSVYVTPPSSAEQTLAASYAFRTEQSGVASLANWALIADPGSHQVCNFTVQAGGGPGSLGVTPSTGLSSGGSAGGPFSPSSQAYTLTNSGGTSINWTASKTQSWVTLSSASGTLTAGASTTLTVSINSGANSLAAGSYNDTVTITNTTNGTGTTTRAVALTVSPAAALSANAGPDKATTTGGSVTLEGSASGGNPPYSYGWTPATGLSDPNAAQPIASPTQTTTYTLTVRDSQSHVASDSATVTVTAGTAYYVATNDPAASDSNPGTEALPWKTLTKAANTAQAGATVYVKAGTYNETLAPQNSGAAGSPITFTAHAGAAVRIDGQNTRQSNVTATQVSYVTVSGFEMVNAVSNAVVLQNTRYFEFVGNHIHNGASRGVVLKAGSLGARIAYNEINDMQDDPVMNWLEYNSSIRYDNTIIEHNYIHDCYVGHSDGIQWVSPSANTIIRYNTIADTTQNIYIAPDHLNVDSLQIYGNVVYNQNYTTWGKGIYVVATAGSDATITNVQIYSNTIGHHVGWCVLLQGAMSNVHIRNNVFSNAGGSGINLSNSADNPDAVSLDYNLYWRPDVGANTLIQWGGSYDTLAQFRAAHPTQETHGVQANPLFVNETQHDYHLNSTSSPAINAGTDVGNAPDFDGTPRPWNGGWDAGAFEYH